MRRKDDDTEKHLKVHMTKFSSSLPRDRHLNSHNIESPAKPSTLAAGRSAHSSALRCRIFPVLRGITAFFATQVVLVADSAHGRKQERRPTAGTAEPAASPSRSHARAY